MYSTLSRNICHVCLSSIIDLLTSKADYLSYQDLFVFGLFVFGGRPFFVDLLCFQTLSFKESSSFAQSYALCCQSIFACELSLTCNL
jgi:hypothetical protein